MNTKKLKILCWNVRGLGDVNKCDVARNIIKNSRCDVSCMQELKWNTFDCRYVNRVLPSFFDKNCVMRIANNSKGGLLIAWKRNYKLLNSWGSEHTISALLEQMSTGWKFLITNVYGPSDDDASKLEFINELRSIHSLITSPWALLGDFNLVRWYVDRSADLRGYGLMCAFNDLVRDLGLMDVELSNRSYTWSNKRPRPVFSRLDRIFLSPHWATAFPIIQMTALAMIVSDHVPLLLNCTMRSTSKPPPAAGDFLAKLQ